MLLTVINYPPKLCYSSPAGLPYRTLYYLTNTVHANFSVIVTFFYMLGQSVVLYAQILTYNISANTNTRYFYVNCVSVTSSGISSVKLLTIRSCIQRKAKSQYGSFFSSRVSSNEKTKPQDRTVHCQTIYPLQTLNVSRLSHKTEQLTAKQSILCER